MSRSLVVGALVAAVTACAPAAGAQDWQTMTTSRQLGTESSLSVDLTYGAGRLELGPAEPGVLYHASLHYDAARVEPVTDYSPGRLRIGIESVRGWRSGANLDQGRLDLYLSPDVPLDLNLRFGASEATVELGGLRVRRAEIATGASDSRVQFSDPNPERMRILELKAGAAAFRAEKLGNANAELLRVSGGVGELTLDFDGEWTSSTSAEVSVGVGSLILLLPRGVGVRLTRKSVLSSFEPSGLVARDGAFYSADWETAPHRLELQVSSAVGSVDVRWIE